MKLLAFGASSSTQSINKELATWVADQLGSNTVLDLNDYEMPIYSIDRERNEGIPSLAAEFKRQVNEADGLVISFAEHNGSYTAAFKNIFDWISRIEKPIWSNKPMFLLSTSPGKRGALGVLQTAEASFPRQGAQVVASFSLPEFRNNFQPERGIVNPELKAAFERQRDQFIDFLSNTAS